jgi:undecaprenyl-diphosphatase
MANPQMDLVMITFSILGYTLVLLALAIPLWLTKRKRTALELVVLLIIIDLIVLAVKLIVARERPVDVRLVIPQALGYSFPSGHTTRVFGAFLLISLSLHQKRVVPIILLFFAVMVGVSRIYLGMHFPSDVIAGAFTGLAIAYAFTKASSTRLFSNFYNRIIRGIDGLINAAKR